MRRPVDTTPGRRQVIADPLHPHGSHAAQQRSNRSLSVPRIGGRTPPDPGTFGVSNRPPGLVQRVVILLCAAGVGATAIATAIAAESPLGPDGYPPHACEARPTPPARPAEFRTETELASYNAAVEHYNTGMERWIGCIQHYVDGAAADIEQIRARMREAIAEANAGP